MRYRGGRALGWSAASGAGFGCAATVVGAAAFLGTLPTEPLMIGAAGHALGLAFIFIVGLVFTLPTGAGLGAVFGLANGFVARTRWGGGWFGVVAIALAFGGLSFPVWADGGLPALLGFGLVPTAACAAHLRYEQVRLQASVSNVPTRRWRV